MEDIIGYESAEYWHPTMNLRWLERVVNINSFTYKTERTLQQCWQSNLGKIEWRDVETYGE